MAFCNFYAFWQRQRQTRMRTIVQWNVANYRKYASGVTLENNLASSFESFVYGVQQHKDGVVDVPEEIMKLLYNFLSAMCFGKQ